MLKIENYTKRYGSKLAVDNLTLEIKAGEIFGFIGHNGAGKTTTIKAVACILPFTEGEIFVDGMSVKKEPMKCKQIMAYIPDNPDLYDFMTGIKYLNFIADVYGVSEADRNERIAKYGDMLDITKDFGSTISSYSHGMKQKLAIISALIHKPKLMLLDEPFVGLDPSAAHELKKVMREMCNEGAAIFFSTHVLEVAEKLCDKIAIIKDGRLVTSGTTDQVRGDSSLEQVFLELVDDEKS